MVSKFCGDPIGHSKDSVQDAIDNALSKIEQKNVTRFEVIESICLQAGDNTYQYRVTLNVFGD